MYKRDKKDEEDGYGNPFAKVDKTSVLQEARVFNETPVNPRKCSLILTKILYLINNGHQLSTLEATDAFFNMTKLFQSKDTTLRRLVYIGIKELSKVAENCYVVTSSLTTDMNAKDDQCRPAAMRALCQITDATTFQGIERYMKQAIVDRNSAVSSAALVSSIHLAKSIPEGVKRWANEAQEALNSDNMMVQLHALGLLYQIRKSDRLAVNKLVTKLIRFNLKSPYALCMLIRIAAKLIDDDATGSDSSYFDFIESCLRHKTEMVVYEAANAIINLRCTTQRELTAAISVLQLMLSSSKPTIRFAAVRTLNKIAMNQPNAVMACNVDLENLITDSNRSIATLAITTLLKTGNENSVERLMKQIATFMSEISDEFKIVVVQATRALCSKFPRKHTVMMSFLSSMLHEEGGYEYKKAIVETIIAIIEDNVEAKEAGLAYLCEFIEDCEHTSLAVKILHLLGREGTKTVSPAKYIRYIYNRLILEKSPVRAAAVSSLAKFAAHCEDLLPQILILLERSTLDTDDEVRDRATYYLNILQQAKQKILLQHLISNNLQVSILGLEKALNDYLTNGNTVTPFDIKSVPLSTNDTLLGDFANKKSATTNVTGGVAGSKTGGATTNGPSPGGVAVERVAAARQDLYAEQLASVPELAALGLGPILKSSLPVELTESETEYVVHCIKHIYRQHVVLQFDCTNTLNEQVLEDVSVSMVIPDGSCFSIATIVKVDQLVYNVPRSIYIALAIDPELDNIGLLSDTFSSVTLKYTVKDCDPSTGQLDGDEGYPDEYVLEDLDLSVADYMQRIMVPDFHAAWDELGEENEMDETYALSNFKTLEEAIKNLITYLGMQVFDRTDRVPDGKTAHTVYLCGIFRGETEVLVRTKLALSVEGGITMRLSVRSTVPEVTEYIASAIV